MYEHIVSWKNSKEAFEQQLDVNIRELNQGFPPHWQHFVSYMDEIEIDRVIDVGCGAGVYGYISKKLNKNYIGYDYSDYAIELAESVWEQELAKYKSSLSGFNEEDEDEFDYWNPPDVGGPGVPQEEVEKNISIRMFNE